KRNESRWRFDAPATQGGSESFSKPRASLQCTRAPRRLRAPAQLAIWPCFEFDFYNFSASSVVEFNPVAHVRGQQRLAERRNPTDGVSFEIEFVNTDNGIGFGRAFFIL